MNYKKLNKVTDSEPTDSEPTGLKLHEQDIIEAVRKRASFREVWVFKNDVCICSSENYWISVKFKESNSGNPTIYPEFYLPENIRTNDKDAIHRVQFLAQVTSLSSVFDTINDLYL